MGLPTVGWGGKQRSGGKGVERQQYWGGGSTVWGGWSSTSKNHSSHHKDKSPKLFELNQS